MKYENIITFTGIILISLGVAVVVSSAQDEYITKMSALAGSPEGYYDTGEDTFYQTIPTIFKITVHGNPTYSYTERAYIDIDFNISQPNKINKSIVDGIKNHALNTYGFVLPDNKIRYQPYTQGTNT